MAGIAEPLASLELMLQSPSVEEYMCILQMCRKKKNLVDANRMHVQICNSGLEAHLALGNHLVPLFVDCGSVFQAQQVFYRLDHRNEHSWTSLIVGYVECEASQDALYLFKRMQEDCVRPSGHTFLALLKACTKLECSERGHVVHAEITKGGFERDSFVANALVDMYAKCGSLMEAQNVFDKLPARDIVSWNSLMTGYADHELFTDVLDHFEQMQVEGISPNAVTFVCILKSCGTVGAINKGQELHVEIAREGLERNLFVGSTLVDMYAKCGLLAEARDAFDELPVQDVISWTALIAGYAEQGLGDKAFKCLEEMQLAGVSPNTVTWVCSLKACFTMIGVVDKGQVVHGEIVKRGLEISGFVGSSLVDFYAECGLLLEARQVFDKLPIQDVVSCTALVSGYVEYGLGEEALNYLEEMEDVPLNSVMIACTVRACGSIGAIDKGREKHVSIVQDSFEDNVFVGNNLIGMYAKCGLLTEARDVFDDLLVRDGVSWSALITGYVEHGLAEEALGCFNQMQLEGLSPDAVTFVCILKACGSIQALDKGWEIHTQITIEGFKEDFYIGNSLVDMYAKCGSLDEARQVFNRLLYVQDIISWNVLISGYAENGMSMESLVCLQEMHSKGLPSNDITYVCSLKACGSIGAIDEGQVIHAEIVRRGFDGHASVGNSLVDLYIKCGLFSEAREVFDKLLARDVVSWNILITGYAEHGLGEDALDCLEEMQLQDISQNAVTYVGILKACCSIGALERGQEVHGEIAKEGLDADPFVSSTLVDMYAKCGLVAEAQAVFDEMPIRAIVSWTALMAGYAEYGFGKEALILLEQMQSEGVPLDAVMFACSLKVCGSLGDIHRVWDFHAEIAKDGYEMDSFVGSTLVDIYAKCGSLVEAQEVFDELAVQDAVSWSALITGYVECGLSEEALNCLDQMQLEGVAPDAIMFVCILKACGNLGATEKGWVIHSHIAKEGFERDHLVVTTLVSMYAKCGLFAESWEVFGELVIQDVVSWNALIVGHTEHGLREEVLNSLEQMQLEGASPDVFTYVFGLKACGGMGAIHKGQEMHMEVTKKGLERDAFLGNSLIDMYANCSLLEEAERVLNKLSVRDVISWNALIAGYAEHGFCGDALCCLEQMQQEGVPPDAATFVSSLKGCSSVENIEPGHKVHADICKEGFEKDFRVAKSLVVVYARYGFLTEGQELFDEVPVQDAVLWSEMILGYADQGESEMALAFYTRMQEQGILPNSVTFMSILGACGNMSALKCGRRIHAQICKVGELQAAKEILASALIDMYGKCGSMADAQQVFDAMPREDVVGWNALITGYAREGESDLVFHSFERMGEEGIHPNGITFLIILTVCSHAGLVDKGLMYFEAMSNEYGITPAIKHHSCMLDLFGRAGRLNEAVEILRDMPFRPDLVVWNTVLGACQKWGNIEVGVEAFDRAASLDENHAASFVLMSNIYADSHV